MRKIGSDTKAEKRKQLTIIVGIVLLVIMVLSTVGYAFLMGDRNSPSGSSSSGTTDTPPVNVGNRWVVTIHGQQFILSHSPQQVENVSVSINETLNSYFDNTLYIDSNNNTEVFSEIYSNIGRFAYRAQGACYGECVEDLPQKDCSSNLIVWRNNTQNTVTQQDHCIFVDGDMRAVDALIYDLLGA